MTDDNPKVGNIFVVDAGTLGRVLKVDGTNVVIHVLDFPYFRVIPSSTFELSTVKIADTMIKAVQQIVLPILSKTWTIEEWEKEVEGLVEYILDDIDEDYDTYDPDSDSFKSYVRRKAKMYAEESDWMTDPVGQEKCIKFSVQYLSVTPAAILSFVSESQRHIWTAVRKASAMAHLIEDVSQQLYDSLEKDDDDDDGEDFDDYDD